MKLCASPCVAKGMQKSIFVELIQILIDLLIFLPALYIAREVILKGGRKCFVLESCCEI